MVQHLAGVPITNLDLSATGGVACDANGRVWTWGRRALGRDGDGTVPAMLDSLPVDVKIVQVSRGHAHVLLLSNDGRVYVFGDGYTGALGTGAKQDESRPVELQRLAATTKVKQVSAGKNFSLLLTQDNQVLAMGQDDYGEIGVGSDAMRYTRSPVPLPALQDVSVTQVSAGELSAAALTADGRVYTWGYGKDGQGGHGDTSVHNTMPRVVAALADKRIVGVSCGEGHTAAVTDTGALYMWGRGREGQLGRGNQLESIAAYRTTPVCVDYFQPSIAATVLSSSSSKSSTQLRHTKVSSHMGDQRVVDVSLGDNHCLVLSEPLK
jgi:alpha-tubulin suppressor-like RCC1 family protein